MKIDMRDMQELKGMKIIGHGSDRLPGDWSALGVSTDTRKPVQGTLFFAIKGERFDGHDFAADAAAHGAAGVVLEKGRPVPAAGLQPGQAVFTVDRTVASLGELAHIVRERYRPVVVAITGSNGKTTTKEMIADLLSSIRATGKTRGNLNNLIGLPLSMLNMEPGTGAWVLELGTSRYGELTELAGMADPDIGVLTNIGRAHLEFFHDLEGVLRAKSELFSAMDKGGTAIVNADDPLAMRSTRGFQGRVLTAGFSDHASLRILSYRVSGSGMEFTVSYEGEDHRLHVPLWGRHYLYDVSLAVLCALHLGADWQAIQTACGRFSAFQGRGNVLSYDNGITVVDDSYNANPDSMREGFAAAAERYGPDHVIAVLGDMLELGESSADQHRSLGRFLAELGIRRFILAGEYGNYTLEGIYSVRREGIQAKQIGDTGVIAGELAAAGKPGDVIYIKGSRSMKLEQVIASYEASAGCSHA